MKTTYGQLVSAGLVTVFSFFSGDSTFARTGGDSRLEYEIPVGLPGASSYERDLPVRAPNGGARADTIDFGYYTIIGGNKYAVMGETWTFDHGAADPLEGWYSKDLTSDDGVYFRRIDPSTWSGHFNSVAAPIPAGNGAAWVGIFEDEADALCWAGGLGYGNHWGQRWQSPLLTYDGSGDVELSFDYFNHSEPEFDYTRVLVRLGSGAEFSLNGVGFDGVIGNPATATYANALFVIPEPDFEGETAFRLVFEFTSDGGWSDEDDEYPTDYSAFGVDNVLLVGNLAGGDVAYDYESDAQGWTGVVGDALGALIGVGDMADYLIADNCVCGLSGNLLEFHDDGPTPGHPFGQHELAFSPPADKTLFGSSLNTVLAELDVYGEMPQANGVFYRPGWNFYPFVCPVTGATQWSGRVGQSTFNYLGDNPTCTSLVTSAGPAVPATAELVSFVWEVYASCDAFAIAPTNCNEVNNFTPVLDNVQIRMTSAPVAPSIAFEIGNNFTDGFSTSGLLSATSPGNVDIVVDKSGYNFDGVRANLGDSLTIVGPNSGPAWDARLWWRIRREGPGQAAIPNYNSWKTNVADGLSIVGASGQFTFGHMDSTQQGATPLKNKRISEFRENDDDFAGELTDGNEMLPDGILAPGTQIQYFLTGNYAATPTEFFLLPDTTGGSFMEIEILPSYRLDGGVAKFPCVLTIDFNTGNQYFVEHALNAALNGAGPGVPIPNPTRWDRYDYDTWKFSAPILRTPNGGDNGMTLVQMLGYRQLILYTGDAEGETFVEDDLRLVSDWLATPSCAGNVNRQGLIANGNHMARILSGIASSFLHNDLGATFVCDAYHEVGCGPTPHDHNECVRLEAAPGAQFPPGIAYNAWGNWCPVVAEFDVIGIGAGGIGNRVYRQVGGGATNYAQVVKSVVGAGTANYRSVLDGVSYNRLSARDLTEECVGDSAHIVSAIASEISAALAWVFGGVGNIPNLCIEPNCGLPVGVDEDAGSGADGVNRLFQNQPNPFNPRTTIKYSLAAAGPAELVIFDVHGRKVRTLVDGAMKQGTHNAVWDGSDDSGHQVGSGVYWSQLTAGEYRSNKKMVILK